MRQIKKGDRVVHQGLDSESGFAKTGVAKDIIVDGDQEIIAAAWDDEERKVAFDGREIKKLVPFSDRSPVISKPKHLKAIIKTRELRAAILFSFLASALLTVLSVSLSLELEIILAFSALIIGAGVFLFTRLRTIRELSDRNAQ